MALVIDASVALAWLLVEQHGEFAEAAIGRALSDDAVAPPLFWLETANALQMRVRRGLLTAKQRDDALADILAVAIRPDDAGPAAALPAVVAAADRHGLTAYDASYLELAARLGATLATLDRPLAAAARAEGLDVLAP